MDEGLVDLAGVELVVDEPALPPVPAANPVLLSDRQVGELLHISGSLVRKLSAPRGDLPCHRIGRRVLYVRDEVLAWFATTSSTPTPRPQAPEPAPLRPFEKYDLGRVPRVRPQGRSRRSRATA
ncbi:MAG: helix-turn-helix domain-containing protein [Frankia sp.]|nr:helix-turn-helix domain-containing protein [Frankia sp.]